MGQDGAPKWPKNGSKNLSVPGSFVILGHLGANLCHVDTLDDGSQKCNEKIQCQVRIPIAGWKSGRPEWIQDGFEMDSEWILGVQFRAQMVHRENAKLIKSIDQTVLLVTPTCTGRTGAGGFSRQSRSDRPHRED